MVENTGYLICSIMSPNKKAFGVWARGVDASQALHLKISLVLGD